LILVVPFGLPRPRLNSVYAISVTSARSVRSSDCGKDDDEALEMVVQIVTGFLATVATGGSGGSDGGRLVAAGLEMGMIAVANVATDATDADAHVAADAAADAPDGLLIDDPNVGFFFCDNNGIGGDDSAKVGIEGGIEGGFITLFD
jgi:hypothetical protein